MRPIKFRYKFKVTSCPDPTDPGYYEDVEYQIFTLEQIESGVVKGYCDNFSAKIVSRSMFIGFSDEGGREIYEGDGLSFDITGISGKVVWHPDLAQFVCRDRGKLDSDYGWSRIGKGMRMRVNPGVLDEKGRVRKVIWKIGEKEYEEVGE